MKRIIVENISKKFNMGFKRNQSFLYRLVSFFSGIETKKEIWALKNISFDVEEGNILGIIGENGSGKSTLLRILAGIHKADNGNITIKGKVISLINLHIGLKDRLTARENIFLCGSLFGLTNKQIKDKFDLIIKFAELEEFMDTKLYQFSNGMLQRLAFSIAIHCNPDILLLDEVFEIGDEDFKKKSANKIKDLVKKGVSVILVSHELPIIEKHCDEVILLDKGKIIKYGNAEKIINEYKK